MNRQIIVLLIAGVYLILPNGGIVLAKENSKPETQQEKCVRQCGLLGSVTKERCKDKFSCTGPGCAQNCDDLQKFVKDTCINTICPD